MAATTQNSPSFSRLSRLGLSLRLKSPRASSSRAREAETQGDDEWYIPYTGPYEPPREPFRQQRDRDSWGDPINGEDYEDDTVLASIDLHQRYEVGSTGDDYWAGAGDGGRVGRGVHERDGSSIGHRDRVQSVWHGPSNTVDRTVPTRRSTVSSSTRPPVHSYVNLNAVGGVGESPIPPTHPVKDNNRMSLADLFVFGGNRPSTERSAKKLLAKKLSRSGQNAPSTQTHRRSSSTGSNSLLGRKTGDPAEDDYYYTSYYFSTAKPHPAKTAETVPSPTSSRHPYAYVPPTLRADDGPQMTPASRLTSTKSGAVRKPATATVAATVASQRGVKQLKNSASTPDLRVGTVSASNSPLARLKGLPKPSPTFKTKDRWLSAETWCDAILFPRPRLKIKHDAPEKGSSSRVVSPPGSPVRRGLEEVPVVEQGVTSRVLAHSRSLVDLRQKRGDAVAAAKEAHSLSQQRLPPPINTRPKSWALDDLDLPTPVPSLARVLEDGEKLDTQRKQWQEQATHSFQNKLTRSLSRTRSKSLTQKGRRYEEPPPNSIDFLAARAYLGNQLLTPIVTDQKFSDAQTISSSGPFSKTGSKSSKPHSGAHSRTDSWGRSALRTATCGLTGTDPAADIYPSDNRLENALKRGDTKVIRLADPALGISASHTPLTSNSPTPSGLTVESRIGIALTTPPLVKTPLDHDAMRLPAHPYAQGGLYSYSTYVSPPSAEKEKAEADTSEFAVPPTTNSALAHELSRQNNSPSPSVPNHPYAQHSSRSSYIPDNFTVRRGREESDVPPPAKMWAQLSPGAVREILPGEIQYSPYMSENGDDMDVSSRNSRTIYDTVGVGETLAYAVRPMGSRDSGLGTSEGHAVVDSSQPQITSFAVKRSYRQPVQYDTTRPPHLLLLAKRPHDPYSAHTFASSPLLHQQDTRPENPRPLTSSRSYELLGPRTTSPESISPPHSPRSFGNPDDLDQFYDLFFKPGHPSSSHQRVPSEMSIASIGSRRREGSGLTSLARQLSEELESMPLERNSGSPFSRPSTTDLPGPISRRPTDSTLEFVFEETSPPESSTTGRSPPGHSALSPFQPSAARIPEDVESLGESSPLPPDDEDENELFRVGVVESVATPPIIDNDYRLSFAGQLSFPETQQTQRPRPENSDASPQPRINSGLQPPSDSATRSSYMTTSTGSRMSALSDFPEPPTERMSLLTSYFDAADSLREIHVDSRSATPPAIPTSSQSDDADDTIRQNPPLTFSGEN